MLNTILEKYYEILGKFYFDKKATRLKTRTTKQLETPGSHVPESLEININLISSGRYTLL